MSGARTTTEELWEALSGKLRGFFNRRVIDPQAAEDLLQETFVRIHKSLDGSGDAQRLGPWVFQIASNLVIDYRRSRSETSEREVDVEDLDPGEEAGEQNLNDVVREWLPAMIDRLPETYRQAVRLFELEGIPQQEIADRLGISLSGAKSRVQRGREKLKSLLFECCSFEQDRRGNVVGYSRSSSTGCDACD